MTNIIEKKTRHFASYNRQSVMILGFHADTNTAYVVNLAAMPLDEAEELRRLAVSPTAQKSDTMATILQREVHPKTGDSWLAHLWANRTRWLGHTFPANLTDMNDDQKSFFEGHGRSVVEDTPTQTETHHVFRASPGSAAEAPAPVREAPMALVEENEVPETTSVPSPSVGATTSGTRTDGVDVLADKLDRLTNALLDGMAAQNRAITALAAKIPGRPGPKPGSKAKKVVTGKPTPVEVFPDMNGTA